jgi:hypothetical protein
MGGEKAVFARIKVGEAFKRRVRAKLKQRIPISQWTPEMVEEELANRKRYSIQDTFKDVDQDSPEFKKWFGESKVVDEDGDPKIVYHGTTHSFDRFETERANIDNHLGAGFYFTDDQGDAQQHYAGEGPDLTNRIDRLSEQIEDAYDIDEISSMYGLDPDEVEAVQGNPSGARQLASEVLKGSSPETVPVYLKFEDPLILEPHGGTRLYIERDEEYYREMAEDEVDKDDYTDEDGDLDEESYEEALSEKADEIYYEDYNPAESGEGVRIRDGILSAALKSGADGPAIWSAVEENFGMLEGQTAQEVFDHLRTVDEVAYMEDDRGELYGNEFLRLVAEEAGYDGIIMDATHANEQWNMDIGYGVNHYIAFEPNQVKSAVENTGAFSTVDDRIKYSLNHNNHESNIAMKSQEQIWYSEMVMALNENLPDKNQAQDKWQRQISELGDRFKTKRVALRDDQNRPTGDFRISETHIPGKFRRSELEWSGVLPWLSTQSGKISKESVMSYLDANLPKLGEVVLSEYGPDVGNEVQQYFDDIQDDLIANDGSTTISDDMGTTLLIEMDDIKPDEEYPTVSVYKEGEVKGKHYLGFEEFIDGVVTQGDFDEFVWPTVRHDSIQMAGPATGYRELVITLDGEDLGYRRPEHFPIKNVVVHARFNTRADAVGRRTLHVEEIQSDHLQALRQKGAGEFIVIDPEETNPDGTNVQWGAGPTKAAALKDAESWVKENVSEDSSQEVIDRLEVEVEGVPSAPFAKEWPALAVKRLLRWATDNGYDQMTWTTGAQQADRFATAFRYSVDKINWKLAGGVYEIDAVKDGKESFHADFDMDGNATAPIVGFTGKPHMSEVIGKELSGQILSGEKSKGSFEGDELTVGAEGFKAFYDKELVNTVKKIVRPFGSTVDTAEINIAEAEDLPAVNVPVHSVDITEKMKETVPSGASMWSRAKYSLQEFAAPDTNSPEFKAWFGDSKVVDENGEPLVVYHGTPVGDFESFDIRLGMTGPISGHPIAKHGFFFTADPSYTDTYSGDSGSVVPTYISLKKPYKMDMFREGITLADERGIAVDEKVTPFIENLKSKGHDGIEIWMGDKLKEYMVFSPTQIKSAISNTGEFSQTDPRIKYSLGASEPWYSTLGRAAGELKQQKGSPDQMLAMLKKSPGVKQEEIDWVGLEDWMMGKKSVTKQEIVGYLNSQDVRAEETISEEGIDLVFSIDDKAVVFSTISGDNSVNITDINPTNASKEEVSAALKRMISWATTNGYDEISWDEDVFGIVPEEEINNIISKYGSEIITDEEVEGLVATKYFDLTTPLKDKAIGGMPKFSLVPGKTKPIQHIDKMQGLVDRLRDNQTDIITKQRELARYIQRSLPIPERGRRELISRITRLALPKTKKTREKYFQAALEMIDNRVEKVEHKTAMDKIFDKLKSLKPTKKDGKVVGKLGAEAHTILNRIEATINTSPEEAARLHESAMKEVGETMEASTPEQKETIYLLTRFADLKNRNSVDAWKAFEDIVTIEETGRFQFQAEEDRRKYRNEQLSQVALREFTGEEDITQDDIIKKKRERKKDEKTILGRFQERISTFDSMHQSWEWMLDKLSKYSEGEVLKGETTDYFRRSAHTAQTDFDYGVSEQTDKMRQASERIFGATKRDLEKILIGNTVDVEETGVHTYKEGAKEEITLSQNEAYKLWQWMQDPTLEKNLAEHGYTKETEKELEKFMTPEVKEWAEWQLYEFYPEYYAGINKVYNRMYHVDLPYNPSYTPMVRERGHEVTDDLLLQANTPYASTMNGGLKLRVENKLPPRLSDGDAILSQHVTQMEHFKAWAEPVREMRAVLGSSKVQGAIDAYHGTSAKTVIQKFLDDFARGGVDRAQVLRGLDLMRSNFVKAVIGVNPVVFAKQLTSFPAYATDMPVHMFMAGLTDFITDPVKKGKLLMTSKKMKARYEKGWERDIAAAMKKAAPAGIADVKNLTDLLMFPTKIGDKWAILAGGWAQYKYNYDRYRKQGVPKEKAHAKAIVDFEMATERSQQASDVKDLGHFQRGGSLYKLFTMFMTSPQAYYRHVSGGYRNLINRRGSTAENLKRIAIAQFVLPMLFQFVASGFEWDEEDQKRAILMGPLNGLFILKDFAEPIVEAIVTGRMPRFGNELPIFTPAKSLAMAIVEANKMLTGEDGDVGKMIDKTLSGLSKTNIPWIGGIPYDPMKRLGTGIYDATTGETEHPKRRAMGFSKYALEREEEPVRRPKRKKVRRSPERRQ